MPIPRVKKNAEDIATIVDDLYAGTLDDLAWHRGIMGLAALANGASAVIFGVDPQTPKVIKAEPHDVAPEEMQEFASHWSDKDIRLAATLDHGVDEFMFDSNLVPISSWRKTDIYNEFLTRIDKPWVLCAWTRKTRETAVLLSIHGSCRRGPFGAEDTHVLKPLMRHVRRVLKIRERLAAVGLRMVVSLTALEKATFGVLILDGDLRIVEANALAHEIMNRRRGIRAGADGTLWLSGSAGSDLYRWAHGGHDAAPGDRGVLRVPDSNLRPLSILLMPLPPSDRGDQRWLLLLFDPEKHLPLEVERVALELGVTAREAELAIRLANGDNLAQAAEAMGVSKLTARTHVKSVFAKTSIRSQTELIRYLTSGPLFGRFSVRSED